jgi:hypothetical protein
VLAEAHYVRFAFVQMVNERYVQPRAYFQLDDHRFDKLPMVGEGTWDDNEDALRGMEYTAAETDLPMTQIIRE